jgi:hypothetical protein
VTRTTVRLATAAAVVAALATTVAISAPVTAFAATTAPTGNLVIQEDNAYLQQSLQNGIIAIALPNATVGYNSSTGFTGTFPVTGGSVNLPGFYGKAQLGGEVLVVNVMTGKTVIFTNLVFDVDNGVVSAVPMGSTTPMSLFDPSGNVAVSTSGTTQKLTSDDLELDPAAAKYADTTLGATFLAGGQHVGTASFSFTPGN